ncbi:MAG: PIN domain-containing protein [Pseudonocardiaceae bacterium]
MLNFVDTNVLVYAHDSSDQLRHQPAAALVDELWRARSGVLSTQVLTEFYAVITRKLVTPMSRRKARVLVDAYGAWPVVQVDSTLIVSASALEEQHSFSFWDALIIEAARRAGAYRLLSEDLQHGRRIDGIVIENPFAPTPPPAR